MHIQIFLGQAAFLGSLYLYYCVSGSKQLAYIVIFVKLRRINQIDNNHKQKTKKQTNKTFNANTFSKNYKKNTKKVISNIFKRINYIYTCTCM